MRLRLIALFAALAALYPLSSASAQTAGFVLVTQTGLRDSNGAMASNVTVCAQAMVKGLAISVRVGSGGGVTTTRQVCTTASSGAWSMPLPDTSQTAPLNATFSLTAIDNLTGDNLLAGYGAVQPTTASGSPGGWCDGGTCVLDKLSPDVATLALIQRGNVGPAGPSGCVGVSGCTGDFNPTSLNGYEVHFQKYAGATLADQFNNAKTAWAGSTSPIRFVMDSPAILSANVTLPVGYDLLLNAGFSGSGQILAGGNNNIRCGGGVTITTNSVSLLATGDGLDLGGCSFTGVNATSFAVSLSAGTAHHHIHDLILSGVGAANISGADDVEVNGLTGVSTISSSYFVLMQGDSTHIRVHDLRVKGYQNGVEWGNGDANPNAGGPNTRAQVTAHGGWYEISHVQCESTLACVWGAIAHDVNSHDNQAISTGDVAFDCEGCIDYTSMNDESIDAANGGFTTFFFADGVKFVHPKCVSNSGNRCFGIYNSSRTPSLNYNTRVIDADFACFNANCPSGGQAAQALSFEGGKFLNAVIESTDYWDGPIVRDAHFISTSTSNTKSAITMGSLVGTSPAIIENDTFDATASVAAGTAAVGVQNQDFNSNVPVIIRGNHNNAYPVDWSATSGSANGGIGMRLTVADNYEAASGPVLTGFSGRDYYTLGPRYINVGDGLYGRMPGIVKTVTLGGNALTAGACDGMVQVATGGAINPNTKFTFISVPPDGYRLEAFYLNGVVAQARICSAGAVGTPSSATYTFTAE